jgi:hypothetical protein
VTLSVIAASHAPGFIQAAKKLTRDPTISVREMPVRLKKSISEILIFRMREQVIQLNPAPKHSGMVYLLHVTS